MIGTPLYVSPEICNEKPYDSKTDIWSLGESSESLYGVGCVLFEMCTRKKAYEASTREVLVFKIANSQHPRLPDTFSEDLRKVYDCLMIKDPE